jgi:hypothetical protein
MELQMNEISQGRLEGACAYLSGAMEYVADHGIGWRRRFIELTHEAGLNLDFIDPTDKPGGEDIKIGENKAEQERLQKEGRWQELKEYVDSYRHFDLRFVDLSDVLIVNVNPGVPQWGTANEVYDAEDQRKPMFFICEGGLYKLPRWLFGVIEFDKKGRSNVYETLEEVVRELQLLDSGMVPLSKKWVLVRRELERVRARREREFKRLRQKP